MLGKIEGKRTRGQQRMRWLAGITNSMDMNVSKLQDIVKDRGAWCSLWGHNELDTTELLNNKNTIQLFRFHSKTEECFWKELWDYTKLTEVHSNHIEPALAS